MGISEAVSLAIGIIGTSIAIYQYAVINESKKRKGEIQFLLAGINNTVLRIQLSWQNQMELLPHPSDSHDLELYRVHAKAKDEFAALSGLVVALEGSIDSDSSAINTMLRKSVDQIKLNNELQTEGLKNPRPQSDYGET